ncbi:MAG: hypothetical protein MJ252_19765 [archaeon]|nr:hypothetical protein [archaeon]
MYLNDKVNNFTDVGVVPDIAKKLAELKSTLGFSTLAFDAEPSDPANYPALLKMFKESKKYLPVSTTLKPKWLIDKVEDFKDKFPAGEYEYYKDCETMTDAIMTVTNSVDLMAYSSTYEGTDVLLNRFKPIAERHPDCKALPIIETDPNEELRSDSLYFSYINGHDAFFNYTVNVSKTWGLLTYHQYLVWAQDLYCKELKKDTEYYFGEPLDCTKRLRL